MKIVLNRPVADILICLLWSILLLPIALLNIQETIRIILGLPFLLFIPGYLLSFMLFPLKKTQNKIDTIERLAYSFALSLAIIPIIGLCLNFTSEGLKLQPILISFIILIISIGAIDLYRWHLTPTKERIIATLNLSLPKPGKNLDTFLTIILLASIITAPASLTYVILSPRTGETFTEFYILSSENTAEDYQRELAIGEENKVIIGIANHEHKTIKYTIEIWLLNQITILNETTFEDEIGYNHLWPIHKINVTLDHTQANVDEQWKPQWEYNFTFNITRKGKFKLLFLLFTTPTENYFFDEDYIDSYNQKIIESYRTVDLGLDVSNLPKIYDVSANPSSTLQNDYLNISCNVFDADGIATVYLRILRPDKQVDTINITQNNTGFLYYCNKTYTVAGKYEYTIKALDKSYNFSESMGQFYIADVPKIIDIGVSPNVSLAGSLINISFMVHDSDGISEVFLNITYPDNSVKNFSIIGNRSGYIVDKETDDLYYIYNSNKRYQTLGKYSYFIWVNDIRGNTNLSEIKQFSVTEQLPVTDFPEISNVLATPLSTSLGGFVNISCRIYDADGISEVFLNITYPDGHVENFSITTNNTGYIYYCNRTYTIVGDYSYFIWVNDTIGNTNVSNIKQFSVTFV